MQEDKRPPILTGELIEHEEFDAHIAKMPPQVSSEDPAGATVKPYSFATPTPRPGFRGLIFVG